VLIFADIPAWATLLTATLTGLAGVGAGASAAALITARHQTAEVFRNRMFEAADTVVGRIVGPMMSAQAAQDRLLSGEETSAQLQDARWFRGEMEGELARLYVVFDPAAAEMAEDVIRAIDRWLEVLHAAISNEVSADRSVTIEEVQRRATEAKEARDSLLHEMNRQMRREGRLFRTW
jgi:hypothetical protein